MRFFEILHENERIKYPRTPHLPWSEGMTADDKTLKSIEHFIGKEVVVTEKMDGENSTLTSEYMHARSVDSKHHPSRDWLKSLWAEKASDIPPGWRIAGENLYAKHSIAYEKLPSYFMVFSIWDENNNALSWDDTVEWCDLIGFHHVPVLWRGVWDEKIIRALFKGQSNAEGYVVRLASSFPYSAFSNSVAKFVRKGHVQTTDKHWMQQTITPNKLQESWFSSPKYLPLESVTPKMVYDACRRNGYSDVKDVFRNIFDQKSYNEIITELNHSVPLYKQNFAPSSRNSLVTLYRGIQGNPDFNKLGIHWSLEAASAWRYTQREISRRGISKREVVMEIQAPQNSIDWLQTICRAIFWPLDKEVNLFLQKTVHIVATEELINGKVINTPMNQSGQI